LSALLARETTSYRAAFIRIGHASLSASERAAVARRRAERFRLLRSSRSDLAPDIQSITWANGKWANGKQANGKWANGRTRHPGLLPLRRAGAASGGDEQGRKNRFYA